MARLTSPSSGPGPKPLLRVRNRCAARPGRPQLDPCGALRSYRQTSPAVAASVGLPADPTRETVWRGLPCHPTVALPPRSRGRQAPGGGRRKVRAALPPAFRRAARAYLAIHWQRPGVSPVGRHLVHPAAACGCRSARRPGLHAAPGPPGLLHGRRTKAYPVLSRQQGTSCDCPIAPPSHCQSTAPAGALPLCSPGQKPPTRLLCATLWHPHHHPPPRSGVPLRALIAAAVRPQN